LLPQIQMGERRGVLLHKIVFVAHTASITGKMLFVTLIVLRALGAARRLRRGRFSFTIHSPGIRSRVHFGILFCGKKKDDEKAASRIPGTSIPAIR
jgi:hypothetical protein